MTSRLIFHFDGFGKELIYIYDFITIKTDEKHGTIFPDFLVIRSDDLMTRGGDFYAAWDEDFGTWSTDVFSVQNKIDHYVREVNEKVKGGAYVPLYISSSSSGVIDRWNKYVKKQMRDNYHQLDDKIIFANDKVNKSDYSSHRLPYALEKKDTPSWNELVSTLYSEPERHKIEWAIGAIATGEAKHIQKFMVFYGSHGTGKSTIINIIQQLFEGYYTIFDAKALGNGSDQFALEAFSGNPLVAIQHDGDLSRIEDNTKLNSIVSHEEMQINEKFKSRYKAKFNAFLIMGTNKPVRITDAKSGIIRRLIDVTPTGNKIPMRRYNQLMKQIPFELGGIAQHCIDVFEEDPEAYENYIPINMIGATNDFYNFVEDMAPDHFVGKEYITLREAWKWYSDYCTDARVPYPMTKRAFKEELKNYFQNFYERRNMERNVYVGFIDDKFEVQKLGEVTEQHKSWIELEKRASVFDIQAADYLAQEANAKGYPRNKWADVSTTLKYIDTSKLHYVQLPVNHIVIDFDIKDKDGNKSLPLNIEAASKFPPTYCEVSQGGQGLHLHYIWTGGDPEKLSRIYDDNIEVKVFTGNSSLRRRLRFCNKLPVSTLSSGLQLKGVDKKMISTEGLKNEKAIRTCIKRNLKKEYHSATKPSVDFIYKVLDDAYKNGVVYDVTDMRPAIMAFAANSTNQSSACLKLVDKMKWHSEGLGPDSETQEHQAAEDKYDKIVFFDIEIFPNLFVVCWKIQGADKVISWINPAPGLLDELVKYKLVGFNNRAYDNHMVYAALMGYSVGELYRLSGRLIGKSENATFGEAYGLSYTDIYEFSSKKQSLKKWEIELGIHHHELGMPWNEPVPEEKWSEVAEYCKDDVDATEATFNACAQDFAARQILSKLSGLTVNDTTRMHATKIIFGNDKHPELVYTDLSEMFPGYKFENGKSSYRGVDPSEGGYVYAEPGYYVNVALLDVASLHPHSIVELNLFGDYTARFKELMDARIAVKHHDYETAAKMLGGVLAPFLGSDEEADKLAQALKIVINSIYGYTSATFPNPFKDPRNVDNIVAKRGALFMIDLMYAVKELGYTVVHIKTDSIKIANADQKIIDFVMEFGKKYGYTFEHEATYDRICLVNNAVYIAKYDEPHKGKYWTATGAQFQEPYVFKSLFSKEAIEFSDLCVTKTVTTALYLDMNENLNEEEHHYRFVGRAGQFCPIKEGCGGGLLMREKDGKYSYATGTKGYRWLESEVVRDNKQEADIDRGYFIQLANDAIDTIDQYVDFYEFVGV